MKDKNAITENYKFIVTPEKVIALSSYRGKTVKGVAKCHPNDVFDLDYGKALAASRCNLKIARKRAKDMSRKYYMKVEEFYSIGDEVKRLYEIASEVLDRKIEAQERLDALLD